MKGISSSGSEAVTASAMPVDLFLAERLRQPAAAHELDHALDAVDQVQGFLVHAHFHQDIARIELPLHRDLLAILDLDRFLHRDQRLADQLPVRGTRVLRDPLLQEVADLVLVARRRLDRVPAIFHRVP
jgi:hypothetical protein